LIRRRRTIKETVWLNSIGVCILATVKYKKRRRFPSCKVGKIEYLTTHINTGKEEKADLQDLVDGHSVKGDGGRELEHEGHLHRYPQAPAYVQRDHTGGGAVRREDGERVALTPLK